MRVLTLLFFLFLWFATSAQSIAKNDAGLEFGAHLVNRKIKGYDGGHLYPRLLFGYRVSNSSTFEAMAGYLNFGYATRTINEIPLSVGYSLNILPLFIKNESFCQRVRFNHGLRYSLMLQQTRHINGDAGLQGHHQIRYAPGIDLYFHKNWGVGFELILGNPNQQVMAFGLKYRL